MRGAYFYIPLLLVLIACSPVNEEPIPAGECQEDVECVPAKCCHADTCVPVDQAPDCTGARCTLECQEGTLDCGQARCACVNNKCSVVQ